MMEMTFANIKSLRSAHLVELAHEADQLDRRSNVVLNILLNNTTDLINSTTIVHDGTEFTRV